MQLMSLLLSLMLLAVPARAVARPWIYYDVRNPENQFLLEQSPDRSALIDIGGEAEFCDKNADLHCFKTDQIQFAIPKKLLEIGAEWQFDGISYKLSRKIRRSLLGRRHLIYFVDAKFEKYQMRFLFSQESGLIAITTIDPTPGLFLLLDGACGFGAPSSCRNLKVGRQDAHGRAGALNTH